MFFAANILASTEERKLKYKLKEYKNGLQYTQNT